MAMTAADRLELRKSFVILDDYIKDKEKTDERITCVEKNQQKNDLIVVRIDTQLKILMWLTSIAVIAIIGVLVKMLFGVPVQ